MKDDIRIVEPTDEEILGEYIESQNRKLNMNDNEVSRLKEFNNNRKTIDELLATASTKKETPVELKTDLADIASKGIDPKIDRIVKNSVNKSRIPVRGKTYKNKSVDKKTLVFVATACVITISGLVASHIVKGNDHDKLVVDRYEEMLDDKIESLPEEQQLLFDQVNHSSDEEIIERYKESLNTLDQSYLSIVDEDKSGLNKKEMGAIDKATDEELQEILYYDVQDNLDGYRGK